LFKILGEQYNIYFSIKNAHLRERKTIKNTKRTGKTLTLKPRLKQLKMSTYRGNIQVYILGEIK